VPTRQDQLQAHRFAWQRMVAALVMRDAEPPRPPLRRSAAAMVASVLLAAAGVGAVAGYGLVRPRPERGWRDEAAIIVERESGARYLYRGGHLRPVLNYASAALILGSPQPRSIRVSRAVLASVPRAPAVGIPGAPDALPDPARMATGGWTVCSHALGEAVLVLGSAPGGGVIGGRPLGEDGVLVQAPDGAVHLLWHARRRIVRDPEVVLAALGWTGRRAQPVAPALIQAVAAGEVLGPIPLAHRGERSAVAGARVGDVFVSASQGGARQYAVALRNGLAAITQVQADLLVGDPRGRQTDAQPLGAGEYARIPKVATTLPVAEPPRTPSLVQTAAICATAGDVVELRVDPPRARPEHAVPVAGRPGLDWVAVPPGGGAVLEAAGVLSLVTDLGVRYPLPRVEVLDALGLGAAPRLRLPAGLVALLPTGPALDPAAAGSALVGTG
jgi:type VII secretion protein EccB